MELSRGNKPSFKEYLKGLRHNPTNTEEQGDDPCLSCGKINCSHPGHIFSIKGEFPEVKTQ